MTVSKKNTGTGSIDNLMPNNKFKILFPNTTTAGLSKCIHKKVVLHAYNNSDIPQIGICKVIHRGIYHQCTFFVIQEN